MAAESQPLPRKAVQCELGQCYNDQCLKTLVPGKEDGVVIQCPHCSKAQKRSMNGLQLGYCSVDCRQEHWEAHHHLECASIIKAAKLDAESKRESTRTLEQLRDENAKIPRILGETYCQGCRKEKNEELMYCHRCRSVVYCSRRCQKDDWKGHKISCKMPFTVGWISPIYRCVLSRDLRGLKTTLEHIQERRLSLQHIDYQDSKGGHSSTLYLAVEHQLLPMIHMLLEGGANANLAFRGFAPLVENSFPLPGRDERLAASIAKLLIERGADPNLNDFMQHSPLQNAVGEDRHHLVRTLLEGKANVNNQDDSGCTALWASAMDGCIKSMRVLHEFKADQTLCLGDSRSPLFVACENGHLVCVKYLVEKMGADVNHPTLVGKKAITPLKIAMFSKRTDIARYLKNRGGRLK